MRTRLVLACLFLVGLGSALAQAHAFLDHASPPGRQYGPDRTS